MKIAKFYSAEIVLAWQHKSSFTKKILWERVFDLISPNMDIPLPHNIWFSASKL